MLRSLELSNYESLEYDMEHYPTHITNYASVLSQRFLAEETENLVHFRSILNILPSQIPSLWNYILVTTLFPTLESV